MKISVITSAKFAVSNWSGGKTTQMVIWPQNASYAARDFAFRISSATVEAEQTDFTLLPNISRIIMVLEGELRLRHQETELRLEKHETFEFDGGLPTQSFGRATDFNLMMHDCRGAMEAIEIEDEPRVINCAADFTCIYIESGEIVASCEEQSYDLPQRTMLLIRGQGVLKLYKKCARELLVDAQKTEARDRKFTSEALKCEENRERTYAIIAKICL